MHIYGKKILSLQKILHRRATPLKQNKTIRVSQTQLEQNERTLLSKGNITHPKETAIFSKHNNKRKKTIKATHDPNKGEF